MTVQLSRSLGVPTSSIRVLEPPSRPIKRARTSLQPSHNEPHHELAGLKVPFARDPFKNSPDSSVSSSKTITGPKSLQASSNTSSHTSTQNKRTSDSIAAAPPPKRVNVPLNSPVCKGLCPKQGWTIDMFCEYCHGMP